MLPVRFFSRLALYFACFALFAGSMAGQALFVKPVKVLGDPNFIGTASNPLAYDSPGPNVVEGRELYGPEGIALDTTGSATAPIVYIADTVNNRVLAYQYQTQLTAGSFADLILGQPDRFTTFAGGGSGVPTSLHYPTGLAVDASGNLYVADTGNNRILRYPQPFAQPAGASGSLEFPDLIIGQTSFSGSSANSSGVKATTLSLLSGGSFSGRTGLAIDSSGNLWVADTGNNRVLRFPASVLKAGQNGPAADTVIGQANLTSSTAATMPMGTQGLDLPNGIAFDSTGRMLVSDHLDRVMVYAANPATNASAIRILGIDTTLTSPMATAIAIGDAASVAVQSSNIVVADTANNRLLVFGSVDSWPAQATQFSPSANEALGQTSFSAAMANEGNPAPSAMSLSSPVDMAASGSELFVVDSNNNRVLVFPIGSTIGQSATRVIGQLGFSYFAPNLVEGKEFNTVVSSILAGSAVLDQSASPPHLYVADTGNNRILGFNSFYSAIEGQAADLVIGQQDLLHTIVNYPSGLAMQPSAQGLNAPSALALDSAGNLYVADTLNARVLRFPAPFASQMAAGESADLVIGQADFVSQVTTPTARTLTAPLGLAFTQNGVNASGSSGWLVVSDFDANRVLLFPRPFTSGMSATIVLGQTSFSGMTGGSMAQQLSLPVGVAVDPKDRILVADAGNSRIQVYPAGSQLVASSNAPLIAVSNGLSEPVGIGVESGGDFWVADSSADALLHFASVDNLPLAIPPYSSDTSLAAITPHSAFPDQYGNLLVADGINRVLYFTPLVDAVNAANSIAGRALAAGTITALYPAISTNVLAPSIEQFSTLPLPTTLAHTQVLVNGTPSPLLYVGPGQINLVLSNSLPQGGTASLEVVNSSTGQIYGAAEIQLASASPGLFLVESLQSGPAAALNQDYSYNSASNPIPRGQTIQLFGTGQGYVPNAPPDGQPAVGILPTAVLPQVTLGSSGSVISVPAGNVASALAPGFVGLWQVNVQIPMNAPTGSVPIVLYMNSIPSNNPAIPSQVVATISIK